jgi:hypothetical protein
MNNRIKLSETDCEYFINEEKKTVSCKMFYRLKMDDDIYMLFAHLFDEYPSCIESVTATTHLSEGDEFDVNKGMQVARAKAETIAYKIARKNVKKLSDKLASMLVGTNDFENRAEDVINHNEEYRKTF